jgi:hypothetical protein
MATKIFMVCLGRKGARTKRCLCLGVVGFVLAAAECAKKGHFDPAQREMVICMTALNSLRILNFHIPTVDRLLEKYHCVQYLMQQYVRHFHVSSKKYTVYCLSVVVHT